MNTLPAERDLPPTVHAATRADLVGTVASRPSRRRWAPAAAAAALLAVVGGSVAAVDRLRDDPPAPVATAASRPVSPATLLNRCTDVVHRNAGTASPQLRAGGPLRIGPVTTDPYGRLVWGVNRTVVVLCEYDPADHGGPVAVITRLGTGPVTYLPAGGPPVTATYDLTGKAAAPSEPAARSWPVRGRVHEDVARLRLTAPGCAPVEIDVDGPYYVTRMIQPVSHTGFEPTITAYDAAGRRLGTV